MPPPVHDSAVPHVQPRAAKRSTTRSAVVLKMNGSTARSAGQKSSRRASSAVNQPSSACSSAVASAPSAGSQSRSVRWIVRSG